TALLATQVGTYTWSASYSGDTLNNGAIDNGANESLTTIKASPTIATVAGHTDSLVVGTTTLSDTATITGGYTHTGTITFPLTAPNATTQTQMVTVTRPTRRSSNLTALLATQVGTYTWSASYSGDGLNNGAIDNGANESQTTIKASPTIATVAGHTDGL